MRDLIIRPGDTINLGRQGENIAEQVQFDVAGWADLYGSGTYTLRLLRPGESIPYEAEVSTSGERVLWNVTETDTAIRGMGEAQLILTVGDIVAKTQIYHTMITPSIGGDPEPPDPAQDWFDQLKGFADAAEESASDAEAWAVGERGGQAVPQSDETYRNNAKFYADQADTAKQSAEYFEGRAAQNAEYAYNIQMSVEQTAQDVLLYKGAPLVAATAAAMTDHNRVYVYVGSETGYTAGNWYYWNGSAWTSGGVYNAVAIQTDTSLSVAGVAADAAAVGNTVTAVEIAMGASVIQWTDGAYINTNHNDKIDVDSPTTSADWSCAKTTCVPGDVFTITADTNGSAGNTNHYAWAFADSEKNRLTGSGTHATAKDAPQGLVITAPQNAAYLVANSYKTSAHGLSKGRAPTSTREDLESLSGKAVQYKGTLKSTDDLTDLPSGYYKKVSTVTPVNWPQTWPDGNGSNAGEIVSLQPDSGGFKSLFYMPFLGTNRQKSTLFFWTKGGDINGGWRQVAMVDDLQEPVSYNDVIAEYANDDGDFDTTFSFSVPLSRKPKTLGMTATYEPDDPENEATAPTVKITIPYSGNVKYISPQYALGDTSVQGESIQYVTREWRIPTRTDDFVTAKITVTIPENTVAKISNVYVIEDRGNVKKPGGIRFDAHLGFLKLQPENTIAAFQMAADLGFDGCITTPKFTSDGVGVCFHDDGSVRDQLRLPDGSTIQEGSQYDKSVANLTYQELVYLDAGAKFGSPGMKVPTLDDYFRVCSLRNMSPVLSLHPSSMFYEATGRSNFEKIKAISDKYGVTGNLWIKTGNPYVLNAALSIFGTAIAGFVVIRDAASNWDFLDNIKGVQAIDGTKLIDDNATSAKEAILPLWAELYYSTVTDTTTPIDTALSEGFPVSVACGSTTISGAEMQRLINAGVTGFTQDTHCSMGLFW